MIKDIYKNTYEEFIKNYEEIHVNPWHEISKEELKKYANDLINSMDIDNPNRFCYFMNYLIKRLSGFSDAHTKMQLLKTAPINFKIIEDEVLVNYTEELKGSTLLSINDVPVDQIINELEEIITYGTPGKRKHQLELSLFNKFCLLGLPSLRKYKEVIYKVKTLDDEIITVQGYPTNDECFNYEKYMYGNVGHYEIRDNAIIYTHSSIQPTYEETIKNAIESLDKENLTDTNTIIIDLRGNWGGNSRLNNYVMDFIKRHSNLKLICLTDYRIFSGGRYAISDLKKLGATFIGDEIATPINCYGNSHWISPNDFKFSISEAFFDPYDGVEVYSKEDFNNIIKGKYEDFIIFKPDIYVTQTKEDYINGVDTTLEYAIEYAKELNNEKHIK